MHQPIARTIHNIDTIIIQSTGIKILDRKYNNIHTLTKRSKYNERSDWLTRITD